MAKYTYFVSGTYKSYGYKDTNFFNTEVTINKPISGLDRIKEVEKMLEKEFGVHSVVIMNFRTFCKG